MKIKIVFDVNTDTREAIARHYGLYGRASHEVCKNNIEALVEAHFEDLVNDHDDFLKSLKVDW